MRSFDKTVFDRQWQHDIVDLLALEEIGPDRFAGLRNQPNAYGALFGGQIVAQALAASDRTVPEGRVVHSLHCYFLRAGRYEGTVEYEVERTRDGGRFSTRRVTAKQDGRVIYSMECSYRSSTSGYSHFSPARTAQTPEDALEPSQLLERVGEEHRDYLALFSGNYPIEVRIPGTVGFFERVADAKRHYWLRAPGSERAGDPTVQRQVFAFMSDFMVAGTTLSPHTIAMPGSHIFVASLDHNIWFHRDLRCDDWLLFEAEGVNAENGVNLTQVRVYDGNGTLVASLAQEALQMPVEPDGD